MVRARDIPKLREAITIRKFLENFVEEKDTQQELFNSEGQPLSEYERDHMAFKKGIDRTYADLHIIWRLRHIDDILSNSEFMNEARDFYGRIKNEGAYELEVNRLKGDLTKFGERKSHFQPTSKAVHVYPQGVRV